MNNFAKLIKSCIKNLLVLKNTGFLLVGFLLLLGGCTPFGSGPGHPLGNPGTLINNHSVQTNPVNYTYNGQGYSQTWNPGSTPKSLELGVSDINSFIPGTPLNPSPIPVTTLSGTTPFVIEADGALTAVKFDLELSSQTFQIPNFVQNDQTTLMRIQMDSSSVSLNLSNLVVTGLDSNGNPISTASLVASSNGQFAYADFVLQPSPGGELINLAPLGLDIDSQVNSILIDTVSVNVPEPSTYLMMGSLLGFGLLTQSKRMRDKG